MIYPSQAEFINTCLAKYWFTDIPADQKWEVAHYPLPACSGEGNTVLLWSADHTVQGLLQSVELDHQCFHYKANGKDLYNLTNYWPAYLPLFQQLKSQFSSRKGKKNVELKLGFHGRSAEQMTADGKKGGKKLAELKLGVHAPGIQSKGGKKAAELGVGAHAPGVGSARAKITNSQRYKCLMTGHISTPAGLSNYQKARGIDTSLRVRVYQPAADPILSLSI